MTLQIRRVVTGHDARGRAVVLFDGPCGRADSRRPGHAARVAWTTETNPADNTGAADAAESDIVAAIANGSVFRIIEYAPGVAPRRHRTSTIDYGVVVSGEIDMRLDDTEVHLRAGDVFVQRGTVHDWINRGSEPCVIAFVLIAAAPVTAGGETLGATG
jgi:mannose-6-phosphate isomerase-like protein (cupin superfamily)